MAEWTQRLPVDLRVLVVDDDAQVLELVKGIMKSMNLTRITALNDSKLIQTKFGPGIVPEFDLVVCDWKMPGLSGLEVLKLVRSVDRDLPFIMLTGNSDLGSVQEAKENGVTDYIAKPFNPDTLRRKVSIIAKLIANRRVANQRPLV